MLTLFIAYLLGSIPSGLVLAQIAGLGDIRAIGSGNIGATNVLRTGHKELAALTLLLDLLKGTAAVLVAKIYAFDLIMAAGIFAILGHVFPVWLRFKGGKGVATALGTLLALSPLLFAYVIILWICVFYVTRISSLSALGSFAAAAVFALAIFSSDLALYTGAVTVLLCVTHRANIQRLLHGGEHRFGSA